MKLKNLNVRVPKPLYFSKVIEFIILKCRAKRKKDSETVEEKRRRLQGRRAVEEDKKFYKQFPCKRFKSGECEYGNDCKYSHDVHLNPGKHDNQQTKPEYME